MLAQSLTVWRITTQRFAASAFSGEDDPHAPPLRGGAAPRGGLPALGRPGDGKGARLYGGRWNRPGQSLVYTAESRSLALLEMLVQDAPLRARYVLIPARVPDTVSIEVIEARALPEDWRSLAARDQLQAVGGGWLREARSCVLAVPSAVVPAEWNYLLNPLHPDFPQIVVGEPSTLETDPRLEVRGRHT